MIDVKFNDLVLYKDLMNVTEYSMGFIEGAQLGKPMLLRNLGTVIKEMLESFIDASARVNPTKLQHVYEWYQSGNPGSRLFNVDVIVSGVGLTFNANFTQSTSIKAGSSVPFYDKAKIMESGNPVTIKPVRAEKLVFDVDGKTVFTKGPVEVSDPGGAAAQDGLSDTFKEFFINYVSQSVFYTAGISEHLRVPREFDLYFPTAKTGGKSAGVSAGIRWISGGIG